MEVHHHSHTERKKWMHYLWEFLMLFLAVFCGFLAENQREHMVEKHREKQYMISMLEDLTQDTAEIGRTIFLINNTILPTQNKSLSLVYADKFTDSTIKIMYETVPRSTNFLTFSFQDRTTQQLKNSGNLRLIENKDLTDSLAAYWYNCDILKNVLLASYEETRKSAKEVIFSLFSFDNYQQYTAWSPLVEKKQLHFLSDDKTQFKKLGNYLANLSTQLSGAFSRDLSEAYAKAVHLILLIKKEYHLE